MSGDNDPTSVDTHDPAERTGTPFALAIISFWETMQALRDLVESIGPIAKDLDGYDQIGKEFAAHLPPAQRAGFLDSWAKSREERVAETTKPAPKSANSEADLWKDLFAMAQEADNPAVMTAVLALARLQRRAPRSFYIYQSLLTMAVGSFELLLGSVWSSFFASRPEMLDDQEKRFSLSDLAEFKNMDDALEYAIERRVDSLLLKSYENWADWFAKRRVTDFAESAMSWDTTREIIQRRHVVVHNGGRVSRRYKEELGEIAAGAEVGSALWTDEMYLKHAIDELLVLGSQVACASWLKLYPDEREDIASFMLVEVVYQLMLVERWQAVAHLSRRTRTIARREYTIWALQCNEWHARKAMDGIDAVRDEIEKWDTSALSSLFQLVRSCLLENLDEAFELIGPVLSSKQLTSEELRTWPILGSLRDDARYLLISQNVDPKPDDKS